MKLATCGCGERKFLGMVLEDENIVLDLAELATDGGHPTSELDMLSDMKAFLASGEEANALPPK